MGIASISNLKPWGDYKESDYTVDQYHNAALIHNHDGPPTSKDQCKLPIKTPDGVVHPGGVQAAAAALGGARGGLKGVSDDQKFAAKKTLLGHYKKMKQNPPDVLKQSDEAGEFLEHYGVKGMRWGVRNDHSKSSSSSKRGGKGTNNKKKPHEMTDEELKGHVARLELEKKYVDLAKHSKSKGSGKAFVAELGKNSAKIATGAATTFAVNKALKAKFGG